MIAACKHVRVHHDHGTDARYRSDGCRCPACRTAHTRYEKGRRVLELAGRRATVPAAGIRDRVGALVNSGMSIRGIAREAGLGLLTVQRIADGRSVTVRVATAAAIDSVSPAILDYARVPALGAVRRLQALAVLGWSAPALAPLLDMNQDTVNRVMTGTPAVAHTTDQAIRRVYRQLITQPAPTPDWHARTTIARNKAWARRNGWVGPLQWDDIDTDEQPATSEPYKPSTVPQQARELQGMGLNELQIGVRLGIKPSTVREYLTRRAAA